MIRKTAHRFYHSANENEIELLPNVNHSRGGLPHISASDPDTWWLGCALDNWKEWYLVNYKEKKIVVGPRGYEADWPDDFDLESLHLWQPEFLESCYDDD